MKIRLFEPKDTLQIAQLFYDTVRKINIQDYSQEQILAWSPNNLFFRNWLKICSSRITYVAEQKDIFDSNRDRIIGFGDLENYGHIDCFYCHYKYQHQGVGTQIYQAIELKAQELNIDRLYTEASITAKPFFLKQGFSILQQQKVACRGQYFINYSMEKQLAK